jgi:hydrogenase-4 component F
VSPDFTGDLLVAFGLVSFALAAFFILLQHNYKRLFAYSSIEHMGLAMVGFGVGGPIGNFGGLFHLVNHAFAKSLAFFAAGNIHRRFKTVEIDEVLPWSAVALLIAGLALAALPPFALFTSEMEIVTALGSLSLPSEWTQSSTGFLIVVLLFCSLVAFGGLLYRITGMVWGVAPKDIAPGEQWSVGHVPIILLGAVLVGFCWALPPPLQQLFEAASTRLVNR